MTLRLLTEHHLEFLSLNGGCTSSSESTVVKMPHCWKSNVAAHLFFSSSDGCHRANFWLHIHQSNKYLVAIDTKLYRVNIHAKTTKIEYNVLNTSILNTTCYNSIMFHDTYQILNAHAQCHIIQDCKNRLYKGRFNVRRLLDLMKTAKVKAYIMYIFGKNKVLCNL